MRFIYLIAAVCVVAGGVMVYSLNSGLSGSNAIARLEGDWRSTERGTIRVSAEGDQAVGVLIALTDGQARAGYTPGETSVVFERDLGQGRFDARVRHKITTGATIADDWDPAPAVLETNDLLTIGHIQFWRQ